MDWSLFRLTEEQDPLFSTYQVRSVPYVHATWSGLLSPYGHWVKIGLLLMATSTMTP